MNCVAAIVDSSALVAWIAVADDDYLPVRIIRLLPAEISVACAVADITQVVRKGDGVRLTLQAEGFLPIPDLSCEVDGIARIHQEVTYRLRIIDSGAMQALLPPHIFESMNRRASVRVTVPNEDSRDIESRSLTTGNTARPAIVNISTGGVLLTYQASEAPQVGERLDIQFRLRGHAPRIRLHGEVVNIRPRGHGSRHCGIRFIDAQGAGSSGHEYIAVFVQRRLAQLARAAGNAKQQT